MKILFRFGEEIFWTMFWVFLALIVGFALLTWIAQRNYPYASGAASWVEQHAVPGY